ncbi:MAG: DUF2017 family protein [Actinomycetaceae bacterium]|nr:DUF2017 family protein [Actinomycetaceae bacterium]
MRPFFADDGGWSAKISSIEAHTIAQTMRALAALLEEEENALDFAHEDWPAGQEDNDAEALRPFHSAMTAQELPKKEEQTPQLSEEELLDYLRRKKQKSPELGVSEDEEMRAASQEKRSDEEVLASLDFEPVQTREKPANPFVAAMIHPMSTDARHAAELRALTTQSICSKKRAALSHVAQELENAAIRGTDVHVTSRSLNSWMMALNDVRQALSGPLGITDDKSALRIAALAEAASDDPENAGDEGVLATMYVVLAWWQESLLEALGDIKGKD